MAIRNYKPTTPGRRKMSTLINEEINVLDLVSTDVMVITEEALKTVEEVLK